ADINRMRPPQHGIPLLPLLNNVAARVHYDQTILPAIVDVRCSVVRAVKRSRRAGRGCIPPWQAADWEGEARIELGKINCLWRLNVRQFAALQDVDTVRALGKDAVHRSPRPLFISG